MITVVIPTYKNKQELVKNLTHNMKYLKKYQIIIVNDNPDDRLEDDLAGFANVTLLNNEMNLGFGSTVNKGIKHAKSKYILLLNSDVLLHDTSFEKTLKQFEENAKLFAISFMQQERDNTLIGKNRIYWNEGMFNHSRANNIKPGLNGWAEGGSCLIDRKKFISLGGFDSLYSPFYWEDIDLSYRAWKAGYEVLFNPSIVVLHYHETTIGKYFNKNFIKKIAYRNQFIFIWKNITDLNMLIQHLLYLPIYLIKMPATGDFVFVEGFFLALLQLPEVISKRWEQSNNRKVRDNDILSKFYE